MLSILIVGETSDRIADLADMLRAVGHSVERIGAAQIVYLDQLIPVFQPHLVLIDYSDPMRDSLEQFCFSASSASPLLVLAHSLDQKTSNQLRDAGLAVYTDNSTDAKALLSLMPILDTMLARERKLQAEVDSLKQELIDRKDIERAKDYLAQYLNCNSNEAYKRLREQAMQQRRTLGDLARAILNMKE